MARDFFIVSLSTHHRRDWDRSVDLCAAAGLAMNCPDASQGVGPILHRGQTEAPAAQFGLKSLAIILHRKPRSLRIEKQFDAYLVCLRMFYDVRQRFLSDSEQCLFYLRGKPANRSSKRKLNIQPGIRRQIFDQ